jgi:NAD(P)-dependent dehydrogenase (short-subunit alcohol dehydrogenase family)
MLDRGYQVVATDLAPPSKPMADSSRYLAVAADVSRQEDNQQIAEAAIRTFGTIDALVLNAGVAGSGAIDQFPLADLDRILAVNLVGPVLGVRAALPALRASAGPRSIVVTASTSGLGGDPGMWAYNASKAGVINLVRSLAMELGPQGIRINSVCPGPTETAMTDALRSHVEMASSLTEAIPLKRWGQPEELAEAIAFLISPAASFITGVALPVDGGVTATTGQFRPPPSVETA